MAGEQGGFLGGRLEQQHVTEAKCDNLVPPLTSGYGAEGPYPVQKALVKDAGAEAPLVFWPGAAAGRHPVIFLAHGYGPNYWQAYKAIIYHLASRGYVVVYGTYPERGISNAQRYAALWSGFMAATRQFNDRMDLSRVGFVGHSFGGGAIPALARKGMSEQGWGSQASFTFVLAPWYAFDAVLRQFPSNMTQVFEVYDQDTINDHRMAIDLFRHSAIGNGRYFFLIHSVKINGCEIVADHSTPARNPSMRLKQYGVFRPLDALGDATLGASSKARSVLDSMGKGSSTTAYQPISLEPSPAAKAPESNYVFKWSSPTNPRRGADDW